MAQGTAFDVKEAVLSNTTFGPQEIRRLVESISADFGNYRVLRDAVQQLEREEELSPATRVRLGVCYYLLGRYRQAVECLSNADGGALARFYLGKAHFALGQYEEAIRAYQAAATAGYDTGLSALGRVEALRYLNQAQEGLKLLDELSGPVEQTAEYLYQRAATTHALLGNPAEVIRFYERAVEADPTHAGALFGMAMENDRHGNDDTAVMLYERCTSRFPAHVGALINLGVLYEDRQQFDRARQCYQRVLDVYPNHERARLFMKDALGSDGGGSDDDAARRRDRITQMLAVPVTDFELSVRSRNCLQKMGIMTLGDLTMTTEQELLASKNFGETSLVEIKEMLATKGLQLGQFADQRPKFEPIVEPQSLSADEQAMLSRPIADLNLSVRARKCMVRLGISTIGELVRHTGDELLECKNFGVTSLNEVREKLTSHNLRLRGE
ncbi:MAG: tetratricopeptide repeat protein [Pirellulales bacterium]|nr:tetratricopeptide repeat protein [Pirellulales bacterium]